MVLGVVGMLGSFATVILSCLPVGGPQTRGGLDEAKGLTWGLRTQRGSSQAPFVLVPQPARVHLGEWRTKTGGQHLECSLIDVVLAWYGQSSGLHLTLHKTGMVAHTCHPSTWEIEVRGSELDLAREGP